MKIKNLQKVLKLEKNVSPKELQEVIDLVTGSDLEKIILEKAEFYYKGWFQDSVGC